MGYRDEKKIKKILDLYFYSKKSVDEIGEEIGMGRTSINYYAKKYGGGLYPRRIGRKIFRKVARLTTYGIKIPLSTCELAGMQKGDWVKAEPANDVVMIRKLNKKEIKNETRIRNRKS